MIRNSGTFSREPARAEYPGKPQDFLGWVDFKTLNTEFREYQRTREVKKPKEVSRAGIRLKIQKEKYGTDGAHNPTERLVTLTLSSDYFKHAREQATRDALHVLTHEKMHGIAHGFAVDVSEDGDRFVFGEDLNEIVTEHAGIVVLNAFYREKGMKEFDVETDGVSAYTEQSESFEPMVTLISETLGMTEEEVWAEIEKTYLRGPGEGMLAGLFASDVSPELYSLLHGKWNKSTRERFSDTVFRSGIAKAVSEALKK